MTHHFFCFYIKLLLVQELKAINSKLTVIKDSSPFLSLIPPSILEWSIWFPRPLQRTLKVSNQLHTQQRTSSFLNYKTKAWTIRNMLYLRHLPKALIVDHVIFEGKLNFATFLVKLNLSQFHCMSFVVDKRGWLSVNQNRPLKGHT